MSTATRIVAFDLGLRRIGVATSQTVTGTTQMLTPLATSDGIPERVALEKRLKEWQFDLLLVYGRYRNG